MYDNEEGHRDRNNRRASTFDTPTCEGLSLPIPQQVLGLVISQDEFPIKGGFPQEESASSQGRIQNTLGFLARKGRRPRKDEYKHNWLPRKEGLGVATQKTRAPRKGRQMGIKHTQTASSQGRDWVSQCRKHGLLTRGGKRALSTHKWLPRKEGIGCHNAANTKTRAPRKERQTGAKRSRNNGSTGYAVNRQDRGP
ncbi:hypothetical protein F5890DRAFT_1589593 [Lentinula detonsa]|uniref:Uncharacterized protein n=1 Tax=Lentinula detonsa TaxID=2804962 RepID=A0AA38ULL0_9AGAR|nr:hypothetical protein F5890DRAFT_1589593 [Lentinula detonsa]